MRQLMLVLATEREIAGPFASLMEQALRGLDQGREPDGDFARGLRRIKAQGFSDARLAALLRIAGGPGNYGGTHTRPAPGRRGAAPFPQRWTPAPENSRPARYFYSTYDADQYGPGPCSATATPG